MTERTYNVALVDQSEVKTVLHSLQMVPRVGDTICVEQHGITTYVVNAVTHVCMKDGGHQIVLMVTNKGSSHG